MDSRVRAGISTVSGNLIAAAAVLVLLPLAGTAGYMAIEGWGFLDALYMTVTTITTVGFREVQPLDDGGQVFTILLAVFGRCGR